jgi:hypothetical protein
MSKKESHMRLNKFANMKNYELPVEEIAPR